LTLETLTLETLTLETLTLETLTLGILTLGILTLGIPMENARCLIHQLWTVGFLDGKPTSLMVTRAMADAR
ncbi:hypothetical protein ACFLZ1_03785, partial [Patescibacteria group bacterium]